MGKKSTQKKRKHKVKVKTQNKNTNKIYIKIDNSQRRRSAVRSKAEKISEPKQQIVHRIYNDIGNYTNEITKRNDAIREQQRLNLTAQPTKIGGTDAETQTSTQKENASSTVPPLSVVAKSTSKLGDFRNRISSLMKRSTMSSAKDEEEKGEPMSPTIRALDLETTTTPLVLRRTKDKGYKKPHAKTAYKIFDMFDTDESVDDSSNASFEKFQQWVLMNEDRKVGGANIGDYSLSALRTLFVNRSSPI